jgi:hypothetical protein
MEGVPVSRDKENSWHYEEYLADINKCDKFRNIRIDPIYILSMRVYCCKLHPEHNFRYDQFCHVYYIVTYKFTDQGCKNWNIRIFYVPI